MAQQQDIRPYRPGDLAAVVAMWRAGKRAAFPCIVRSGISPPPENEPDLEYLRRP